MELELPKETKIHPVINVCNIKKHYGFPPDTVKGPSLESRIDEYEVEAIMNKKDGGRTYQVK